MVQVEIDEFQNYEKAIGALGESYKVLSKASNIDASTQEMRLNDLKNRIILTKKFIQLKRLVNSILISPWFNSKFTTPSLEVVVAALPV